MHDIAIIGAGLSGVCMAIHLKRSGIDSFTIFEKADEVGGVWRDNSYPGAACDLVSHLYSYSFAPYGWTYNYARQPSILRYVNDCADTFGVRAHIEFKTEIAEAWFDPDASLWRLRTAEGDVRSARVLIAAVGQLNRPHVPDLPGRDGFLGVSFHSSRWNHGHDLAGRSVAVIGNGCSAVQFIPEIAPQVGHLTVFQRSPKWIIPKWDRQISPVMRQVFERFPLSQRISRATWFLMAETIAYSPVHHGLFGRALTALARHHLRRQVADAELRAKLVPDYTFGCNRMILSNDYYPALARDNVTLVTDAIERVTPSGVLTADGTHYDADTIIYATGFESTRFLSPMHITGPGGSLHERWSAGASAHLGMTVPGFPNMFVLYGPNTSSANNSVIYMLEKQANYVLGCLKLLGGATTIEVTESAMAEYSRDLESRLSRTVWSGGCRSWYKTDSGRITALWPGRATSYGRATRRPNPAHFIVSA
ncbi:putative flavoprotein CzcO associated with the cation diffusion facilitator CzcD [Lentzea flava]|nr:putative flavoprotein CzcO associated with the cation diffusion facilitator CzcD [Lentzea flava]